MNNLKVDTIVVCCDMNGRCLQNSGVCCCDIANRSRLLSDGPAGEHIAPDDGECFTREVQSNPTTPQYFAFSPISNYIFGRNVFDKN